MGTTQILPDGWDFLSNTQHARSGLSVAPCGVFILPQKSPRDPETSQACSVSSSRTRMNEAFPFVHGGPTCVSTLVNSLCMRCMVDVCAYEHTCVEVCMPRCKHMEATGGSLGLMSWRQSPTEPGIHPL